MEPVPSKQAIQSRWIKIVTVFLYVTVIWNVIEGSVSIYFGYQSNDISLFAFGIDSLIEVLSASLVLYHMICTSLPTLTTKRINLHESKPLTGNSNKSVLFTLETERKLTLFIGCLLVIFCLFACVGGIFRLIEGIPPSNTVFGIVIGAICIIAMFIMWYYKTKASVILNSSTLSSDAACSLGCIKLSTVLCVGSILYEIWHSLWWVDAVTAIIIGLLVGYEGYQTIKNAKDREKFQGGCGCCGAADSGLAKYFRVKFEKEWKAKDGETTDDGCGDCCDEDVEKDDCCGANGKCSGNADAKKKAVSSYGAIAKDEKASGVSACEKGCCGSK